MGVRIMSEQTEPAVEQAATEQPAQVDPSKLPDDHPLVKTLAAQKDEIRALKDKASRLDELENASKSEAEKQAEALAAAQKSLAEAEAKVVRRELALEHKLSKDDAALLDTITDEDALKALAGRLAKAAEPAGPRTPKPDTNQGRPVNGGPRSTADSFADFFRSNLSER